MTRREVDLNGTSWWLGQAPEGADPARPRWEELDQIGEWLPATVPGNVRADLIRAGRLPDLLYGRQADASQWVDEHCWWFRRPLSLLAKPGERVHLCLRGVDYIGDVYVNGHHLARHEGMFSPQCYEIGHLLQPENELALRIVGSHWLPNDRSSLWLKFLNILESRVSSLSSRFPQRRETLKCQMSFGWDFAPPLRTMGIWDDVYATLSQGILIQDAAVQQASVDGKARLLVDVTIDSNYEGTAQLRCTLTGETFEGTAVTACRLVEVAAGPNRHTIELDVDQPRLWWPWDHGRPDLYRLAIEVWQGGRLLDSFTRTVGLRQIEFEDWALYLNGHRVYARGANWVPSHILPGLAREADYLSLLSLARQANMNMLRVWGGGLREKRSFYDLCDRMGILVWQEFPLACAFLTRYPNSASYLHLVEAEIQSIVRDLRQHASLVIWCGGNEFSPTRNAPLVETLSRVVAREDPSRPFLPASPGDGDNHNWKVWHHYQAPAAYRDDEAQFASEFGLQAPPEEASLRNFIPAEELWPIGPSWAFHGADPGKLRRYARPFLQDREQELASFICASQRAQVLGLQVAIEHYRRRKARGCGGVLVWQLNEPWPAISWALVDFYRRTKPAYDMVRRLFQPLLISLDFPLRPYCTGAQIPVDIWIVNDRHHTLTRCEVDVVLWDGLGKAVNRFTQEVDITPDSARRLGQVKWILPSGPDWRLSGQLSCRGQCLARNEYELSMVDTIRPTLRQQLRSAISSLFLPS
jgi:beta-mannosidase